MEPIVHGLEREFDGQAAVVRLNAADPAVAALQQELGVRGHPAFAVLDGQTRVIAAFVGPQEADRLRAALATAVE